MITRKGEESEDRGGGHGGGEQGGVSLKKKGRKEKNLSLKNWNGTI